MLTRHQQGFRVIHPSGLPLTCSPRSERAPSGFPLSFAPGRYQPRTSGRGRVWNTNPKSRLRHHPEPPIDELTHNVRPRVAPRSHAASRPQSVSDAPNPGGRHRAGRAGHRHRLPLSTCHVRSGPWMTWRVTAPDSTVAPLPLRLTCRQPTAGIPVRPPCRANRLRRQPALADHPGLTPATARILTRSRRTSPRQGPAAPELPGQRPIRTPQEPAVPRAGSCRTGSFPSAYPFDARTPPKAPAISATAPDGHAHGQRTRAEPTSASAADRDANLDRRLSCNSPAFPRKRLVRPFTSGFCGASSRAADGAARPGSLWPRQPHP